ncbi:MAG: NAD(P)-dependent oxidoreductase [Candidatus Omnitrophota bacterium]|jgi:nucleoside-diphosphate-sugar epimerase
MSEFKASSLVKLNGPEIKQAIITGATGTLGIALVKYLAELGISVTALIRPGSKRNADIPKLDKIRIVECDLAALPSLTKQLSHQYDAFFHLGWNTASREIANDPFIQAQSILYTLDAVRLSHDLGCKVFVGAGSQAEYGQVEGLLTADTPANPKTSYGIAKYTAGKLSRQLCEAFGVRHCWCRILSVYGPFDRETTAAMYCIHSLLKGEKPSLTKSEQIWDYIYSADCAKALYLIAKKGRHGVAYPIGSGQARPLRKYFECIRDYINPLLPLGIGDKQYSDGQIMRLSADIAVLTKDTGFVPEYSFEAGIKETIGWVKKRAQ